MKFEYFAYEIEHACIYAWNEWNVGVWDVEMKFKILKNLFVWNYYWDFK